MKRTKKLTADEIAEMADRGEDVTPYLGKIEEGYFSRAVQKEIQRVNVDFGLDILEQLDSIAKKLNISRQAVVKMAIQDYLTRYHLGEHARSS